MVSPWRCAGCLQWNWHWRTACRDCGPKGCITPEITGYITEDVEPECICIGDGDISELVQDFFPAFEDDLSTCPAEKCLRDSGIDEHNVTIEDCIFEGNATAGDTPPNGRSLLTATVGHIAPDLAGKLPGYVSTTMGNKFVDNSDMYFQHRPPTEFKQDGLSMLGTEGYITPEITPQASPTKDLEDELSMQDPMGYAGHCGRVEHFQRRPQTRLKQDRLSMLGTEHYITPEITSQASLTKDLDDELNVQGPIGYEDHCGRMEDFQCQHQTELKHASTVDAVTSSLLATTGYITPGITNHGDFCSVA